MMLGHVSSAAQRRSYPTFRALLTAVLDYFAQLATPDDEKQGKKPKVAGAQMKTKAM